MLDCTSPTEKDYSEAISNFADRARRIRNKVISKQTNASKLIRDLRLKLANLEAELSEYKMGKKLPIIPEKNENSELVS